VFAGYVNNLRDARAADGGTVLLVDSGDTFQGDVESNLSEGAVIVDAYNAIGYTAEAIGNHDFDFGSLDSPTSRQLPGDLRGALKARAAQARYPFLAANLLDTTTGRAVDWPNVRPSVLVDAAGVKVGIIGVMTIDALKSTLAANVQGLRVAPLDAAIAAEAARLRAAGAGIVVVASHAGGRCDRFDRPADPSSCDAESEIFTVANSLPHGLVDVIAAGHTHAGIAHEVNGIGIVEAFSRGQAFGRVDVVFDRRTRTIVRKRLFAPRTICGGREVRATGFCVADGKPGDAATYEGEEIRADQVVVQAMAPALRRVRELQSTSFGVSLDTPIPRAGELGSPLGNLLAEALRVGVAGADVAAINNAGRGLRADLSAGALTFGRLYDVFPFDNRVVKVVLTAGDLGRWLASEIAAGRRGTLGMSGVVVHATCTGGTVRVDQFRLDGTPLHDLDRLLAVTIGGPTPSGGLAASGPLGGGGPPGETAVVREIFEDWFRRSGSVTQQQIDDATHRSLAYAGAPASGCMVSGNAR